MTVNVIGAGLAGCEAAYQLAKRNIPVRLFEMKPSKMTPAHSSPDFAELVCSNSLRSGEITNAAGLLKEEMRILDSLIIKAADASRVPAGSALAVDRGTFSSYITREIRENENIEVVQKELSSLPDGITVVATGPLTSDPLSSFLSEFLGEEALHFFDAAAPIVDAGSISDKAFFCSRYGRGDPSDYLNCPMNEDEYDAFYSALLTAKTAEVHGFEENQKVFEGCMPVEVMAKRGKDTLRFGPMKPVGIKHPETGKEYYAIVQLRRENTAGTTYNLVGFQTHLTFGEQKRIFGMIPGLENAEFLRYGVMHRNTYINSPRLLTPTYAMREKPEIFFAGQMTGVEGYIESASSGLFAGISAARLALGKESFTFPDITVIGGLSHYISNPANTSFQPMNANFGLIPPLDFKVKGGKAAVAAKRAERSLEYINSVKETLL